jgi:methyl-accepting chemotaxis protein
MMRFLLTHLRQGDLSVRLPIDGQDETARMTEAFNITCAQLGQVVRRLKEAAHQVAGGAEGLTASADQVSHSTQQLARSAYVQRQATEQVASAMIQLSASVQQLEDTLGAARGEGQRAVDLARAALTLGLEARHLVEGIRDRSEKAAQASDLISDLGQRLTQALVNVPSEGVHKALERTLQASDLAATLARQNGAAVEEGRARLEDLASALEGTLNALTAVDRLAHEIGLVAREQAAASQEVSQRMQETSKGTGDVQLAAAQLANTVLEVHLTSKSLAGVAQGLATTADAFTYA